MSRCLRTSVGCLRKRIEENLCRKSLGMRVRMQEERTRPLRKDAWRSRHCSSKKMDFWNENSKKAGWMKSGISSLAFR